MSLNLNSAGSSGGGSTKARPLAKAGVQAARVIHVVDLGIQERSFAGETKPPVRQIFVNFELVNENHKDDEGKDFRLNLSAKRMNFLKDEKATIVKFLSSIDPDGSCGGDMSKLVGRACLVTVVHNKKEKDGKAVTYANLGGVSLPPEGFEIKPLAGKPVVFEFDNPTKEALIELPKFLHNILKQSLKYAGSKTESLLSEIESSTETTESSINEKPY